MQQPQPWRGGRGSGKEGTQGNRDKWIGDRGGQAGRLQRPGLGGIQKKSKLNESEQQINQIKTFKCLYSHQKLKKKKSWFDGELQVFLQQKKCLLYKLEENQSNSRDLLDSKYCPDLEIDRIVNGIADSVEFEKYLVEIDHSSVIQQSQGAPIGSIATKSTSMINSLQSPLQPPPMNSVQHLTSKLKKAPFKVPQTVIPIQQTSEDQSTSKQQTKVDPTSRKRGYYSVDEEELDDIWDSTHRDCEDNDSVQTLQRDPFLSLGTNSSNLSSLDFNITSDLQSSALTSSSHPQRRDGDSIQIASSSTDVSGANSWDVVDGSVLATEPRERYSFQDGGDDDSNPWRRYGEGYEDDEGEDHREDECEWPQEDQNTVTGPDVFSVSEAPFAVPPSLPIAEAKIESNIWSRLGDSSHFGFDESSN
jgi:hypothetical protein